MNKLEDEAGIIGSGDHGQGPGELSGSEIDPIDQLLELASRDGIYGVMGILTDPRISHGDKSAVVELMIYDLPGRLSRGDIRLKEVRPELNAILMSDATSITSGLPWADGIKRGLMTLYEDDPSQFHVVNSRIRISDGVRRLDMFDVHICGPKRLAGYLTYALSMYNQGRRTPVFRPRGRWERRNVPVIDRRGGLFLLLSEIVERCETGRLDIDKFVGVAKDYLLRGRFKKFDVISELAEHDDTGFLEHLYDELKGDIGETSWDFLYRAGGYQELDDVERGEGWSEEDDLDEWWGY